MEERSKKIDTPLGDLIAAAGEVAFEFSNNDKEAYKMARLALVELVRRVSQPVDFDEDLESESSNFQVH